MLYVLVFERVFSFPVRSVTINGKRSDHTGGCPLQQNFSATAATHENQVRSGHGCSCFQPEGTCVFRELATVKLDRLARDLISFEDGVRRYLMHFTLLQHHTSTGLKSEPENSPTERRNKQIHSYGMRLPRAPKFASPLPVPALSSPKSEGKLDLSEKRGYREKILQQCNPFTQGSYSYVGRSLSSQCTLGIT
jgi:hypothetical protein